MLFKPVSVAALAGGSIFLSTPFAVSSAAAKDENGEDNDGGGHHANLRSKSVQPFKPKSILDFGAPRQDHRELAQCETQVAFDPQLCNANRCTSNDLQVVGASIELPGVCFSCEPCTQVTGTLTLAIDNGTGSTRTTFGYGATLIEQKDPTCDGDEPETCTDSRCADGGALLPNTITDQGFGTFTYTCGSRLFLEDVWQFWSPANGGSDCPSYETCKDIYPKCGVVPSVEIAPPVSIQEVNAGCIEGTDTIIIDADVFGGVPPYSYSWTDSDGVEVATTEDLTDVPDGVYTLTVTDSDPDGPCTTQRDFGPYDCCFFEAACKVIDDPTIECDDPVPDPLSQLDVFTYTGVPCGTIAFGSSDVETPGSCVDEQIITRTYTLLDDVNGNGLLDEGEEFLDCTQDITVQDTTAPVLSGVPADETVECDSVPAPASPTASDHCDPAPVITFNEVRTDGNCPDNYILTRTWTATDGCGNSSSQTQTITVQDTTAPVLSGVPADETVECDSVPAPASPTASDNCDDAPVITFNEVRTDGNCPDNYSLARTWTATDGCGNSSSQTQTITVQDTTAPVLSGVPADETVECDSVPAPASPTASDNCDDAPVITFNEVRTDGNCPDNYILTRTWTARDGCGNSSSQTQTITVQDTTAPVLSGVPADETVECDSVPAPASPTASDNCDDAPVITFNEVRTDGNCPDNYSLARTWTATDGCGNSSSQTQTITVQDTTAPEIQGCPADTSVNICNDPVPAAPVLNATDNCDGTVTVDGPDCCFDGAGITRTWTATDRCGNQAIDCVQQIAFAPDCAVQNSTAAMTEEEASLLEQDNTHST